VAVRVQVSVADRVQVVWRIESTRIRNAILSSLFTYLLVLNMGREGGRKEKKGGPWCAGIPLA
jgi:hypothetical protein